MLPPRWLRRVLVAPVALLVIGAALFGMPLWLLVAAALSPVLPGRWRPLRFLWFVVLYLALEFVSLVLLFGLWVGTGFGAAVRAGWSMRMHYRLIRWFLRVLAWESERVLGVRIRVDGASPEDGVGHPQLVMARHAGVGDSFLVVHALMNWYHREPRIVLKYTLQWDPAIDIILNRLPNRFISPEPGRAGPVVERSIGELAADLDADDCLVIFPEGGNFTPARRLRAIDRLRSAGLTDAAAAAGQMSHVLAPRPGGVRAALEAAPGADAVFVAHTGLEHLASAYDLWHHLPMDTEIRMHWWRVPAAEVPRGDDIADWLFQWWARIDAWVAEHSIEVVAPRVVDMSGAAAPDVTAPDVTAPGVAAPGVAAPGVADPDVADPQAPPP